MSINPSVSILIPNFNGNTLLMRNLPSVLNCSKQYAGLSEIIVIDDASTEGGLDEIKSAFRNIRFLDHKVNKGFSEAINTGVKVASGDLIFLLNSDVSPECNAMNKLATFFSEEDIFSVSPLILDEDNHPNTYSWNLRAFSWGKFSRQKWDLMTAKKLAETHHLPTLYSSGGSMMARKTMFQSLQGFDEIFYPFYFEDQDLGARAWKKGWRSLFCPDAIVEHQRKGSIQSEVPAWKVKLIQRRNSFIFEWIHLGVLKLLLNRLPQYLKQIFIRTLRGDWKFLLGFILATTLLPKVTLRRFTKSSDKSYEDIIQQINREVSNLKAAIK